jgi:methanogenic corrinoid protein MtbC1
MHPFYAEFVKMLEAGDRERCVSPCLELLQKGEITVVQLYTDVLGPALNRVVCDEAPEVCIWKEHLRTAIVRGVVESAFPFVMKARKPANGKKALVVCPPDELHEIGPRMVADFFTICGFKVVFVGANTPKDSFLSAVSLERPDYLAVSVTNFYHLMATRTLVTEAKQRHPAMKVIVGGKAFKSNPEKAREFGADLHLDTFEEIEKLAGGGAP